MLPISEDYDGAKMTTHENGKRLFTPMLIVMIAIGTTDLIFALDSIPAIFGLTKEPYLVFTANVFALMGLRQLYFLLGGLLDRLVYLSYGLAVVLGFIGVKLVMEALADNKLPFINGGEHVGWAPHIPIWLSLAGHPRHPGHHHRRQPDQVLPDRAEAGRRPPLTRWRRPAPAGTRSAGATRCAPTRVAVAVGRQWLLDDPAAAGAGVQHPPVAAGPGAAVTKPTWWIARPGRAKK